MLQNQNILSHDENIDNQKQLLSLMSFMELHVYSRENLNRFSPAHELSLLSPDRCRQPHLIIWVNKNSFTLPKNINRSVHKHANKRFDGRTTLSIIFASEYCADNFRKTDSIAKKTT